MVTGIISIVLDTVLAFPIALISLIVSLVVLKKERRNAILISDIFILILWIATIVVGAISVSQSVVSGEHIIANAMGFIALGLMVIGVILAGIVLYLTIERVSESHIVKNCEIKTPKNEDDYIEKIQKLKELLDAGAISEEEYNNKKKEILGE